MQTGSSSRLLECRYSLRQCHSAVMDGYQYCQTHILEDKNSPFQQCTYVSAKTGRRCIQASLKPSKKESLCPQHITKVNRARSAAARKQLATGSDTAESLLEDLEHYSSTLYNNSRGEPKSHRHDSANSYLAELASSSDSDIEDRNFTSSLFWQPDSECDSIDSENEDMFKYAEVLTEEEATRITRDKLIRLQSLYIEQFKWLQNVLKERRRKYLLSRRSERAAKITERDGNGADDEDDLTDDGLVLGEDETSKEYVACRRYHKKHGQEALMYMKSQERRRAVCDPSAVDGPVYNRYRHASKHGTKYCSLKSMKCHEKSLPFTRYCTNHVEFDTRQVLFRRCGYEAVAGGLSCERVVANINKNTRCDYHTNVTDLQSMSVNTDDEQDSLNEVNVVDETVPASASMAVDSMDDFDNSCEQQEGGPKKMSNGAQQGANTSNGLSNLTDARELEGCDNDM